MLLFWFVSPFCPCRTTLGETYPTVSASKCRPTQFVSPYLLCKPNLDDTYLIPGHGVSPIPPGASEKGELLPYFAARACFSFGLFHLICFVSRIWMIHTCFPIQVSLASTTVMSHIILLLILVHAVIRLVDRFLHILSGF